MLDVALIKLFDASQVTLDYLHNIYFEFLRISINIVTSIRILKDLSQILELLIKELEI